MITYHMESATIIVISSSSGLILAELIREIVGRGPKIGQNKIKVAPIVVLLRNTMMRFRHFSAIHICGWF